VSNDGSVIVALYVDDIMIGGKTDEKIEEGREPLLIVLR